MREELANWAMEFPLAVVREAFAGSETAKFVTHDLPNALKIALPELESEYFIDASAGQGGWTHTPWVAVLNPAVTTTVQDGFYVVYLLNADGSHLYLSLNQGCTLLKNAVGITKAAKELRQRANLMRRRIANHASRLHAGDIDLRSSLWRAKLYEAGDVLNVDYDTSRMPAETELLADLREALQLYRRLWLEGGWSAEDEIIQDAKADGLDEKISLDQAKLYRLHKAIERQSTHAKIVKKILGTRCMACKLELGQAYGPLAQGLIHAHHLTPLSSLNAGQQVRLDPKKDFAVLCPNCHAVIHRMDDVSDLDGLRALITPSEDASRILRGAA
jgi:5-methylcytosine-specific restriction protein A